MSINASQTTYGEGGFALTGSNMGNGQTSWMTNGNMGFLSANDKNLTIGGAYNMGDFNLGVNMNTVTNDENEDYERNVMTASLGYSMSDNAGLSLMRATDNNGTDTDVTYTWLTLTVTP